MVNEFEARPRLQEDRVKVCDMDKGKFACVKLCGAELSFTENKQVVPGAFWFVPAVSTGHENVQGTQSLILPGLNSPPAGVFPLNKLQINIGHHEFS